MAERYTKLSPLDRNLYTPGSPVVILAGSLLRDNETGKVLGQFKFKNIADKIIKALVIKVDAYDVSGKELPGVAEYQYLDLFAQRDVEFGQKSAVILPESITRSVQVQCISAVFVDDSQWAAPQDAVWSPLPTQEKISDVLGFSLAQQYQRMIADTAEYMPTDHNDLWLCACGGINHAEEAACHNCGYTKPELLQALDEESLTEGLNKHRADMQAIAEEEERERAKKAAERAALRKKIAKIFAISAVIAMIIAAGLLLNKYVLIPLREYNDAIALMDAGQYDEAIIAFDAMGDYKDSAIKSDECRTAILDGKYNDALALMEAGQYPGAIAAFRSLGEYKDSNDKISECNIAILDGRYNVALTAMESGNYTGAIVILEGLDGYKNSSELIKESQYQQALLLIQQESYEDARTLLLEIPRYKDVPSHLNKFHYRITAVHTLHHDDDYQTRTFEYEFDDNGVLKRVIITSSLGHTEVYDIVGGLITSYNTTYIGGGSYGTVTWNRSATFTKEQGGTIRRDITYTSSDGSISKTSERFWVFTAADGTRQIEITRWSDRYWESNPNQVGCYEVEQNFAYYDTVEWTLFYDDNNLECLDYLMFYIDLDYQGATVYDLYEVY